MTATAYTDAEIISAVKAYMFGSEHPDVVGYRTQSLERDMANMGWFLWQMRRLCQLGKFTNKRILDVGAGLGWQALTISMIGNNSVVASDILPSMTEGATQCAHSLRKQGVKFDMTPVNADVCDNDLPDASFDAIYSMEAVEHVRDLDKMYDSCARLLKSNGTLIIINDCNAMNKKERAYLEDVWDKRENSWEWCHYLRSIRPVEHADATPFSIVRRNIAKEANPNLTDEELDRIAYHTAGLLKDQIERTARKYKTGELLPIRPDIDWCRDPYTGEYAERLLHPFQMKDHIEQRGFKVKVRHGFRRQPLRMLNGIGWPLINEILFNVRPLFFIVATKTQQ